MSITSLLGQSVDLYVKTGYSRYGREEVGPGANYKARFQKTTKARLLPNGEQVIITGIAYVKPDVSIDNDDKVTIDSVDYKVFGVYTAVDGRGDTHHKKVELMKWQET